MSRPKSPPGPRSWVVATSLALILATGAYAAPELLPVSAGITSASRVGSWFLFGGNMPWLNWSADFGGGSTNGGVSSNITEVDAKLQAAHNAGMHMIRWWVFEGGSWQIQRDASGTPTGLHPNVYTDLDAALNEAAKYDISYNLTLFSSTNDDATTHQWWEDSAKRQALVNVLTPLFKRYATNPRVHTWEIVNEPEWQSRNGITSVGGMLATADALANAIHQNSPALVTVGHAQVQDMATWRGHPLDYYSPHYYDNFGTGSNDPFVTAASSVSPDGKPVVIGEFQASSGLTPSAQARWQALYSGGYAGGWNWSLSPEHTSDKIPTDLNAAAAFSSGKNDLGPQQSSQPATSTATPTLTSVPATSTLTPTSVPATSTRTPTSVPATATPTPTAQPGGQTTWSMRASVSSSQVARGTSIQVRDQVTATQNATALVDIEIYDQGWHKVYQRFWDNQSFSAGRTRQFSTTWSVPLTAAPGTYTVMVGVFGPGWNSVYSFNKGAATFVVH